MTNLLRSYLGLDKEPESKPDPRLEKTVKFTRPTKKEKADSRLEKKSEPEPEPEPDLDEDDEAMPRR